MRRKKGKSPEINYNELLKIIDKNQTGQAAKWLKKHSQLPGFKLDINTIGKHKNVQYRIFDFLRKKLRMGSVDEKMSHIITQYSNYNCKSVVEPFDALCLAILRNKSQAKQLIPKVYNINAFYGNTNLKRTPLMLAAQQGDIETMIELLDHKADPFMKDNNNNDKYDTLETAVVYRQAKAVQALFNYFLAQASQSEIFKEKFSNMMAQSKAAHLAAADETTDMLNLLIKNDIDINRVDENKLTPFMIAIARKNYDMFSFIFDHPKFQRELSTEMILSCVQLAEQSQNSYIIARMNYYVKILSKDSKVYLESKLLRMFKDDDKAIQLYCENVELNVEDKNHSPLELFIIHERIGLIEWLLKTRKHELNNVTILSALRIAFENPNKKIIAMMHRAFSSNIPVVMFALFAHFMIIEKRFNIAYFLIPNLKMFVESPYLQQFNLDPIVLISGACYLTQNLEKILAPKKIERTLAIIGSVPYLKTYLDASLNNQKALILLNRLLKQVPSSPTLSLVSGCPAIPMIHSYSPLKFLTEEKNLTLAAAKALIKGRVNVFDGSQSAAPAIYQQDDTKKNRQWLGGLLASTKLKLIPIDRTSDCFLYIPVQFRNEPVLNKSRWQFSQENGIANVHLENDPIQLWLKFSNVDQLIDLGENYWKCEITKPGTKDRFLCIKLTDPDSGALIIPVTFKKNGLHVHHPNLKTEVTLLIESENLTSSLRHGLGISV